MTDTKTICQITAVVNKAYTHRILDALKVAGIHQVHIAAGRTCILEERRTFFRSLAGEMVVAEEPADVLRFIVTPEVEDQALSVVARAAAIQRPGHGSVFSESFEVSKRHALCDVASAVRFDGELVGMFEGLVRLTCIVQRGQSDRLSRVALEAGVVPVITYGIGTGLRDKLGLLRITIPAEKELLTVVVAAYDADSLLELLIAAGNLDQPGRGFIYQAPINKGLLDTRITRGSSPHAASIEQIITALDALQGGMEWRRTGRFDGSATKKRNFFGGTDLCVIYDEGQSLALVAAAMKAGAAGATIERLKLVGASAQAGERRLSPARVRCRMIVAEEKVDGIVAAMDGAGAFGDEAQGLVLRKPIPRAFTYIPGKA